MKKQMSVQLTTTVLILTTILTACVAPNPTKLAAKDTLFQTSTLSALQAGDFDGALTIGELKRHGDFGLGTFNALDGEMVVLDGQVYQAKDDGVAYLAGDAEQTPFAAVTFFGADQTLTTEKPMMCAEFQTFLDAQLPSINAPYAIKVSGTFADLKVRAPHKESPPYPTLTDALADQVVFDAQNITGTLVGFRLPDYMAGANAAGYHFHFISEDRQTGGHVLDCQTGKLTVEVDDIDQYQVENLSNGTMQAHAPAESVTAQAPMGSATGHEPPLVYGVYSTAVEEPWVNVIHTALNAAQEAGNITYSYAEHLGLDGEMGRTLRQMIADSPPDIVFADAFDNEASLRQLAQEHPEIAFVLGSDMGAKAPNISVFNSWNYESAYLAGMLAGGLTKSDLIGVVAGFPEGAVNRAVNAFIAGARAINPDVDVQTTFINSWFDLDAARAATLAQIESGVDVIYAERDGVIETAAAKGVYTIGNLVDQKAVAPNYVVTSVMWNMESTVQHVVGEMADGAFAAEDLAHYSMMAHGGSHLAAINEDIVGGIPAHLLEQVKARQAEIVSGQFQVPSDENTPPASIPISIAIGAPNAPVYLNFDVAQALGYFADENLDAHLQYFDGGSDAAAALESGAVDFSGNAMDHVLVAQMAGQSLRMVMNFLDQPCAALVIRNELQDAIRSPADLRGRKVGVTRFGSATHTLLVFMAANAGVPATDFEVVEVGVSAMPDALAQGTVDAAMGVPPYTTQLIEAGKAAMLVDLCQPAEAQASIGGGLPFTGLLTRVDVIADQPDTVQRVVNALVKAQLFITTHSAQEIVASLPPEATGGDVAAFTEAVAATLPAFSRQGGLIDPAGLQVLLGLHKTFGTIGDDTEVNLDALYDNQFVKAALDK